ncbi:hypothetical protein [Chromobacterium sp. Panama]|uniref:hypothetical protein n=1 Tax=Chromobacterium sp. Panama TaxID=2161826 RepID=UPI0011B23712|nr:hypothetical protein [Chromobacterium sp. Panama]
MSRLQTLEKKVLVWDSRQHRLRALALKSKSIEKFWESEQKRCVVGTFDSRANYLDVLQALQATLEGINKR